MRQWYIIHATLYDLSCQKSLAHCQPYESCQEVYKFPLYYFTILQGPRRVLDGTGQGAYYLINVTNISSILKERGKSFIPSAETERLGREDE